MDRPEPSPDGMYAPHEDDFFRPPSSKPPVSSVPPNLSAGIRIAGKYELTRKVGIGAMGEVWAAKHLSLGEEVAIKLVLRDVSHEDGSSNDSRFLLEARVASQLSRKTRHIVSVTDHGEDGPYAYLVMELLDGESLDARLARTGPMDVARVVPLVYQVSRALAVAHADGIVHRDLKPSNVFVTVDEEGKALIKILDFGIAKLRASVRRVRVTASAAKHHTLRGFLLGTPAYMSPEQARGRPIDHRVDVWALAVIAFHLLTGQFPFDGETAEELFARLCRVEPLPIAAYRPDLPREVSDLFAKAFAERIEDRYPSAVAFASAFERLGAAVSRATDGPPHPMSAITVPPPGPAVAEVSGPTSAGEPSQSAPPRPRVPPVGDRSMIAAGIPSRKLGPRLAIGAAVVAALLGTGVLATSRGDRDPGSPPGLAAGASLGGRSATAGEEPPPPEPIAALPLGPTGGRLDGSRGGAPSSAATPVPQGATTTASLPPERSPGVPADGAGHPVTTSPQPRAVDRSEVF